MGEIAEMMLDGTLCVLCGGYIEEGEPQGVPRFCSKDCEELARAIRGGADAGEERREVARRKAKRERDETRIRSLEAALREAIAAFEAQGMDATDDSAAGEAIEEWRATLEGRVKVGEGGGR